MRRYYEPPRSTHGPKLGHDFLAHAANIVPYSLPVYREDILLRGGASR